MERKKSKPIIAICYDFDKTLAKKNMQEYAFISTIGVKTQDFWDEVKEETKTNHMDQNSAWMRLMLEKTRLNKSSIKKDAFTQQGQKITFFPGVGKWFENINQYGEKAGVRIKHYIISSGLKEIIEGTAIATAGYFDKIYGSTFYYNVDGIAEWPALIVNYTTKTQFLFRIAKGKLDEEDESVNESVSVDELVIPYENFIYIGDSETDIPSMRLVKKNGGCSIGVYANNKKSKVYELFDKERIDFYALADYRMKSQLARDVKMFIDKIGVQERIIKEKEKLQNEIEPYKMYKLLSGNLPNFDSREEMLQGVKSRIKSDLE